METKDKHRLDPFPMESVGNDAQIELRMLHDLGVRLDPTSKILDFGCGSGAAVSGLRSLGYQAFGCDIRHRSEDTPLDEGRHLFLMSDGRIPFPDSTFDVVISQSVFEHVIDFQLAVSETCRVMKPGGIAIHTLPSRYYLPLEPHIFIPLGSFFSPRWWVWLWAYLGIRNSFQRAWPAREVYKENCEYIRKNINYGYLTDNHLRHGFGRYCSRVVFREDLLLKHGIGASRHLWAIARRFAFISTFYRWFRMRAVVCWK